MAGSCIQAAAQYPVVMGARLIAGVVVVICGFARAAEAGIGFSGEKKLNNLVSELLEVSSISQSSQSFTFRRSSDGWIFVEETKIQPSLERLNVKDWLDCEIENTSSSSETRLFSFFSPEKPIPASAARANPQMTTTTPAINLAPMTTGYCAAAWIQLPAIFQPRMTRIQSGFYLLTSDFKTSGPDLRRQTPATND